MGYKVVGVVVGIRLCADEEEKCGNYIAIGSALVRLSVNEIIVVIHREVAAVCVSSVFVTVFTMNRVLVITVDKLRKELLIILLSSVLSIVIGIQICIPLSQRNSLAGDRKPHNLINFLHRRGLMT